MRCKKCGAPIENGVCTYCGSPVDEAAGNQSREADINDVYEQERKALYGSGRNVSPCHKTVALLLCIFFGFFGAHQFYAKKYAMGVLYLCTFGLIYIGWFYDIYRIAAGKFTDHCGNVIQ